MILLDLDHEPPEPVFSLYLVLRDQSRLRIGQPLYTPMQIRNLLGAVRWEGLIPDLSPRARAVFDDIAANEFHYPRYTQLCLATSSASTKT